MATVLPTSRVGAHTAPATAWTTPLWAAALAAVGILLVHAETVASIVAIWMRSETFAHGFVVVPIALWLAWRDRREIAQIPARPAWFALGIVAVAGVAWLAMALADVLGLRQFALLFMVQAAVVAVLGTRIAKAALLPLAFLVFAVPTGEFLLPTMIDWTADFTVWALQVSGVPVYREANHFVIPSGAWSVVEACSGLRYLIASLMIGVVYSAVSYRSRWRKLAFLAASIVVPLVANWLRAYLIVMIGHLSDNTLAVGVDHIVYGWVFFGIVMALLFWVGSFWAEAAAQGDRAAAPVAAAIPEASAGTFFGVALAAIALAALPLVLRGVVEHRTAVPVPSLTEIPAPAGYGARARPEPAGWTPDFHDETTRLRQGFARDGIPVGLHVVVYANQAKGRELVTSRNEIVHAINDKWRVVDRGLVRIRFHDRDVDAGRTVVSDGAGRYVVTWVYWVDGHVTASGIVAKAWLGWARLRGESDLSALVAVIAPYRPDAQASAKAMEALAPAVDRALRGVEAP